MQIFKPDYGYYCSAEQLDDKRLNKQILEIWEAIQILKGDNTKMHAKHPIILEYAKYGERAIDDLNFYFAVLCYEYLERFGKEHSYKQYVNYQRYLGFDLPMQKVFIYHYQGEIIINNNHVKNAYRKLLKDKWDEAFLSGNRRRIPKWTNREVPKWYQIPEVRE